jgi:DNA polymerase-3 subunit epsilon
MKKRLNLEQLNALPASTRVLYFDTETTGKLLYREPLTHPGQPRVVQLAAELCLLGAPTDTPTALASVSCLWQPNGWTIPPDATAVHGFTDADCRAHGLRGDYALQLFIGLLVCAEVVVAYNLEFDESLLLIEGQHYSRPLLFEDLAGFCAMRAATPICAIPKPWNATPADPYKWPNLAEAHQRLVGAPLADAHEALADTRAARRVTQALRRQLAAVKAGA